MPPTAALLRWRPRAPIPSLVCATLLEAANLGRGHLPYPCPCCRCRCWYPCTPVPLSLPLPVSLYTYPAAACTPVPLSQADKVKAILGTGLKGIEYVSLDASTADLAR